MLCDRQGNTWISSLRSGLAMFDPDTKQFNFFMHDPMQANSIVSNSVVNLFEDKSGMIWVGSEGYGVDYFHPSSNHFISIRQSYFQQPTLADNSCRAVAEDESGKLWIATYKGLSVFDRDKNAYKNYLLAQDEQSAANNSIRAVLPDNNGYVWIGTGAGLNRYDSRTGRITPINQEDSIPQVYISHLFRDKKDSIWVCTVRGLFRLKSNGKFENVFRRKELQKYLNRHVSSMYQDRKGRLWLSFPTYGVLSYDQATGQFDFYELKKLDPISTPP